MTRLPGHEDCHSCPQCGRAYSAACVTGNTLTCTGDAMHEIEHRARRRTAPGAWWIDHQVDSGQHPDTHPWEVWHHNPTDGPILVAAVTSWNKADRYIELRNHVDARNPISTGPTDPGTLTVTTSDGRTTTYRYPADITSVRIGA